MSAEQVQARIDGALRVAAGWAAGEVGEPLSIQTMGASLLRSMALQAQRYMLEAHTLTEERDRYRKALEEIAEGGIHSGNMIAKRALAS